MSERESGPTANDERQDVSASSEKPVDTSKSPATAGNSEAAEREQDRQLETGEENPT